MPRILISGENSFIGNSYKRFSTNKELSFVSLKKTRPDQVDFGGIDVVIHLAAIVHVTDPISPEEYRSVNRDLTLSFAENAKRAGVSQFIFMSTSKVYGNYEEGIIWNENSDCRPTDYYGISKLEAEMALKRLNSDSFIVSVIRTPVVYGPGNKANMMKLMKLVRYLPVLPLGDSRNKRYFNYIENLINCIDRIIDTRLPGVFISMDKDSVSTTELVKYIAESLDRKILLIRIPVFIRRLMIKVYPEKIEQLFGSCLFDNTITKNRLNYIPLFSTREGIMRTLNRTSGISDE